VDFATVWKARDELRASYAAQGITPDKTIIAYCNGGLESSHVYFALHNLLGYRACVCMTARSPNGRKGSSCR